MFQIDEHLCPLLDSNCPSIFATKPLGVQLIAQLLLGIQFNFGVMCVHLNLTIYDAGILVTFFLSY